MINSQQLKACLKLLDQPGIDVKYVWREVYRHDLFMFAKHVMGYKDLTIKTHGPIVRALEADTKRKLICVPRGTFKSSIADIAFAVHKLVYNPNLRILIDSEVYGNSKNFLREIKGHMKSESFLDLYGDFEGPTWTESEIIVSKRTKNLKEPSIAVSGIGAEKTSQHYDIIISDDLSSTQSVATPEQAKKVINHYKLYTSLLEPNGILVIIGTRYAALDIIGFVLENEIGFKTTKELFEKFPQGIGEIDVSRQPV